MHALLLIAHGSRREESNQEIRILTKKLQDKLSDKYDEIKCCFLELADPLIPDAINNLSLSFKKITIFPYFLATGTHVAEDIPLFIEKAKEHHPNINFTLLPHFGASEKICECLSLSINNKI